MRSGFFVAIRGICGGFRRRDAAIGGNVAGAGKGRGYFAGSDRASGV